MTGRESEREQPAKQGEDRGGKPDESITKQSEEFHTEPLSLHGQRDPSPHLDCDDTMGLVFSVLPLFYISKALGLACFSLKRIDSHISFRFSSSGASYNLLMLIVFVFLTVFTNIGRQNMSYPNKTLMTSIAGSLEFNSALIHTIMMILNVNFYQKTLIKCIEELQNIDLTVQMCKVTLPHLKNRNVLFALLLCALLALGGLIALDTMMAISTDSYTPLVCTFGYTVSKLMVLIAECQLIAWLLALRQRFDYLNECLDSSGAADEKLVKTLSRVHGSLSTLAASINTIFALPLLFSIATGFFHILSSVFYETKTLFQSKEEDKIFFIVLFDVYWCSYLWSKLFVICYLCSSTSHEARRSCAIVHNAVRRSKTLLIRKHVLGTITTYMVILIQFDTSTNTSSNNNSNATG